MTESDHRPADQRPDAVVERDGLLERVRLVESQPLEDRAAAFASLHDELRTRLEHSGGAGA